MINESAKDQKTQLQEFLQAKKKALPKYTLLKVEGDMHEQLFFVMCTVKGILYETKGKGETRRKAEQVAARDF